MSALRLLHKSNPSTKSSAKVVRKVLFQAPNPRDLPPPANLAMDQSTSVIPNPIHPPKEEKEEQKEPKSHSNSNSPKPANEGVDDPGPLTQNEDEDPRSSLSPLSQANSPIEDETSGDPPSLVTPTPPTKNKSPPNSAKSQTSHASFDGFQEVKSSALDEMEEYSSNVDEAEEYDIIPMEGKIFEIEDYYCASPWESLISEIEKTLKSWGLKNGSEECSETLHESLRFPFSAFA